MGSAQVARSTGVEARPSANTIRVAYGVMVDMRNGKTLSGAVHFAAATLGISPMAVCHALTVVQDWMADTGVELDTLAA